MSDVAFRGTRLVSASLDRRVCVDAPLLGKAYGPQTSVGLFMHRRQIWLQLAVRKRGPKHSLC